MKTTHPMIERFLADLERSGVVRAGRGQKGVMQTAWPASAISMRPSLQTPQTSKCPLC